MGAISRSPSVTSPPPITITSGSSTFVKLASPSPSHQANSPSTGAAASSPASGGRNDMLAPDSVGIAAGDRRTRSGAVRRPRPHGRGGRARTPTRSAPSSRGARRGSGRRAGSTMTWPISPEKLLAPRTSRPSLMMPPPMPVPERHQSASRCHGHTEGMLARHGTRGVVVHDDRPATGEAGDDAVVTASRSPAASSARTAASRPGRRVRARLPRARRPGGPASTGRQLVGAPRQDVEHASPPRRLARSSATTVPDSSTTVASTWCPRHRSRRRSTGRGAAVIAATRRAPSGRGRRRA